MNDPLPLFDRKGAKNARTERIQPNSTNSFQHFLQSSHCGAKTQYINIVKTVVVWRKVNSNQIFKFLLLTHFTESGISVYAPGDVVIKISLNAIGRTKWT